MVSIFDSDIKQLANDAVEGIWRNEIAEQETYIAKHEGAGFGGADTFVCQFESRAHRDSETLRGRTILVTEHAAAASAVLERFAVLARNTSIKDGRFEVYPRIAQAGIDYQKKNGDCIELVQCMAEEAIAIVHEPRILYFAYGSNMDRDQMAYRCPDSVFTTVAQLDGYCFMMDAAGFATVDEASELNVQGALWAISMVDEAELDRYEGVASGCYRKAYPHVSIPDDCSCWPLVYISQRIPFSETSFRKGYCEKVLNAAKALGLDGETIRQISSIKIES